MIGEGRCAKGSQQSFAKGVVQEFIREGGKVDAILAANDVTAIGVVNGLQRMGVSVPDDIAVVGFDDLEIATYIRPALTTIRQPIRRMGEEAVKLLLERISNEGSVARTKHLLLPPELVVRESCGASDNYSDDE
jgi:LacI family transcriptional regulator